MSIAPQPPEGGKTPRRRRPTARAGSRWRLLVHDLATQPRGHYGTARNVYGYEPDSDLKWADPALRKRIVEQRRDFEERGLSTSQVYADTEFDELVVGGTKDVWLHIEQMDVGAWWINVGGVTLWVNADRYGRPTRVTVYSPWNYDSPREGCEYECVWPSDGDV